MLAAPVGIHVVRDDKLLDEGSFIDHVEIVNIDKVLLADGDKLYLPTLSRLRKGHVETGEIVVSFRTRNEHVAGIVDSTRHGLDNLGEDVTGVEHGDIQVLHFGDRPERLGPYGLFGLHHHLDAQVQGDVVAILHRAVIRDLGLQNLLYARCKAQCTKDGKNPENMSHILHNQ